MALLNPPELRPSVMLPIVRYLGAQRAQQDMRERLVATLAPVTLKGTGPQRDVRENLSSAIELGFIVENGEMVSLADGVLLSVREGPDAVVRLLRTRILAEDLNSSAWPSQVGARDLTNALSWFLTYAPSESPTKMVDAPRSAQILQNRDFGPRQGEDDSSNWPIGNATRWSTFRRWACSLGFAWVSPSGNLIPDPTVAIRDVLPDIFESSVELSANDFVDRVGACLPVLDRGRYRQFIIQNWERPASEFRGITASLTEALDRLTIEGAIIVDDRHDVERVAKSDGSTFSHVRVGGR